MDGFDNFDDFERAFADQVDEEIHQVDDRIDFSLCKHCNIGMAVLKNRYVCMTCGWSDESIEVADHTSITSDSTYNVTSNGIRCIGNNAHRYQKILRSCAGPSESYYETTLNNTLFGYQTTASAKIQIPKTVLFAVADQYRHIRGLGHSARGPIFRAILAAFTFYECLKCNLGYRPEDIYTWFDIDPSTYSKGDKKVRELLDHGHLDIDIRAVDPFESYLINFAKEMNVPDNGINVMLDIMNIVVTRTTINPNAKASTRALAVLTFYLEATGSEIGQDDLRARFGCNFGTIRQMANDIVMIALDLEEVFKKHDVTFVGFKDNMPKQIAKLDGKRKVKKGARIAIA